MSWGGGIPLEILLGAGAVSRIVFCFSSLDIFGLAPLFRRAVEQDQVTIDEWSAFATAAFAARRVLVTVEEVVPAGTLGTLRNSFVLPRHFVHALSVVPAGAYPASCLPYYTADFAALARVTAQSPPPPATLRTGRAGPVAGSGRAHPRDGQDRGGRTGRAICLAASAPRARHGGRAHRVLARPPA